MAELIPQEFSKKCVAIVKFGPAGFPTDGFSPAQYFQVTIDPAFVSSSGDYIRFGQNDGDEIQGWQRVAAITVIEILADWTDGVKPEIKVGHDAVIMNVLKE